MRWYFLAAVFLALVLLPSVDAAETGCCLPPTGQCFDRGSFDSMEAFEDACEQAGTEGIAADQRPDACTAYADQCQTGCCCAGQDVFDSPTINSNEELLSTTRYACGFKDGFNFKQLPQGSTCVEVCRGVQDDDEDDAEGEYAVSGTVVNRSGGNPLEGADVFIPLADGDISTTSASDGSYTLEGVPAMNTRIFAVHEACQPGQSKPVLVDQERAGISIELPCTLEACQHNGPTFVDAPSVVRGTDDVRFILGIEDACQDFVQYEVFRCDESWENCVGIATTSEPEIIDTGLPAETTMCYKAQARFRGGIVAEGSEDSSACVTTGSEDCMEDRGGEWCGNEEGAPAVQSCDEENNLVSEVCEAEQVCSARSGKPECVAAPSCDLCNGFVGLFASLLGQYEISTGLLTATCESVCSLDSTLNARPLMVDAYKSCQAVSSCEMYTNQEACEDDVCAITACSWKTVNEELGQGLCVSDEEPDCGSCDERFGYCTRDMCESISDECYYDGQQNGLSSTKGCINREEAACRYYDTREDCVGQAGDAAFDVTYADGERSGGTNELEQESQDRLGLGVCVWTGERCIKDADMRNSGEDDCIENGRIYNDEGCLQDVTPPSTDFFLTDPLVYSRAAVRSLPYSVQDDRTPLQDIETFICFGEGCYPSETLSTVSLPEEGTHVLRYYSMDASRNLEPIQQKEITIKDTGEPAIEDITIEENR